MHLHFEKFYLHLKDCELYNILHEEYADLQGWSILYTILHLQ